MDLSRVRFAMAVRTLGDGLVYLLVTKCALQLGVLCLALGQCLKDVVVTCTTVL